MASTAISAQGSLLEVGVASNGATAFVEIDNVKSFTAFDGTAADIDVTDLRSKGKEYRSGLQDEGAFNFDINVNRADPGQQALIAARKAGSVTPFRLTLPDGEVATFNVLVKAFPTAGSVDGVLTGTVTTRITGEVTWTPADNG